MSLNLIDIYPSVVYNQCVMFKTISNTCCKSAVTKSTTNSAENFNLFTFK